MNTWMEALAKRLLHDSVAQCDIRAAVKRASCYPPTIRLPRLGVFATKGAWGRLARCSPLAQEYLVLLHLHGECASFWHKVSVDATCELRLRELQQSSTL